MKRSEEGQLLTDIVLDVFKLHGLLISEGDKLAEEFDQTSARWKVLGALATFEDSMTVADIARNMGLTRQAVQRLANELQVDGLLKSEENPNHKRARLMTLSQKGKDIYKKIDKKQIEWINDKSKDLDRNDLKIVKKQIQNIIQSMSNNY